MNLWDFHTHQNQVALTIYQWKLGADPPNGNFSVGIHPWDLDLDWESDFRELEAIAQSDSKVLAIGESGFDRLKGPAINLQKTAFRAHTQLARDLGIPMILHCVKGHDLLVEYLKREKNPPNILWHGWNLKPELAVQLLNYPVYFSFGSALLKENSNASQWLKVCPKDRVFLETDNSGIGITEIYQSASLILGLSSGHLGELSIHNWNRISSRKIV